MTDTKDRIKSEIESADVVLFMKGTPQAPQCGFSQQVVQILNHLGAPYKAINVLADGEIREGIKAFSNWPTIPQLYVKREFIGGCDITREMFQSGELVALFDKEGVPHARPRRPEGSRACSRIAAARERLRARAPALERHGVDARDRRGHD